MVRERVQGRQARSLHAARDGQRHEQGVSCVHLAPAERTRNSEGVPIIHARRIALRTARGERDQRDLTRHVGLRRTEFQIEERKVAGDVRIPRIRAECSQLKIERLEYIAPRSERRARLIGETACFGRRRRACTQPCVVRNPGQARRVGDGSVLHRLVGARGYRQHACDFRLRLPGDAWNGIQEDSAPLRSEVFLRVLIGCTDARFGRG